jgi:5-amino-6-(5-phosphoribosylamino)uracil reductase
VAGDHVVLLVTERAGNDYLAHLQAAGVSYLFCGPKDVNLHTALDKLGSAFKLRKLMLQGGGKFNGAMLHAGLVDEISHITVPVADGGMGISSMFDIPGDAPPKAAATLRLISRKPLPGSVTWCRYKVVTNWVKKTG